MKKLFFLLSCILLVSCLSQPDIVFAPDSMQDLIVSNDFDWKTTRDITVKFPQAIQGMVLITSEDDSLMFYKGYLDGTQSNVSVALSIPSYLTNIKVNSKLISLNGNVATYTSDAASMVHAMRVNASVIQNYSVHLNGTTEWINFPNTASIAFPNIFTMEAWVKQEHQQTAKIIQKGDWDGFSLGVDLYHGWMTSACNAAMEATNVMWGKGQPVLNKWYHLAATFDGRTLKLYVDGVLVNSGTLTGGLHVNGRTINIGSDNGNQKFFKGDLDNVSMWTVALSAADIVKTIDNGITGSESGLVGCWKFNEGSGATVRNSAPAVHDGALTGSFSSDIAYGLDSDGDGVLDNYDDFPNDPLRAFKNNYPSGGVGSLAFEDLWPAQGDFDFNDLVVDYRFSNISNTKNMLVETYATFILRAAGASYKNSFGFQLQGTIAAADMTVTGSVLTGQLINLASNGLESNQNKPTVIVFDNSMSLLKFPGSGLGVNTSLGAPHVKPDTIVVHIVYTPDKYTLADLNVAAFNPFMIVNQDRGKEIHLVDNAPTALADMSNFAKVSDTSDPSRGRYYRTKDNLPWAINIPQRIDYAFEKTDILKAYLKMGLWAQTCGLNCNDWYENKAGYRNNTYIYK